MIYNLYIIRNYFGIDTKLWGNRAKNSEQDGIYISYIYVCGLQFDGDTLCDYRASRELLQSERPYNLA